MTTPSPPPPRPRSPFVCEVHPQQSRLSFGAHLLRPHHQQVPYPLRPRRLQPHCLRMGAEWGSHCAGAAWSPTQTEPEPGWIPAHPHRFHCPTALLSILSQSCLCPQLISILSSPAYLSHHIPTSLPSPSILYPVPHLHSSPIPSITITYPHPIPSLLLSPTHSPSIPITVPSPHIAVDPHQLDGVLRPQQPHHELKVPLLPPRGRGGGRSGGRRLLGGQQQRGSPDQREALPGAEGP